MQNFTIFVATDNESAMKIFKEDIEEHSALTNHTIRVIDGNSFGNIGHVDRSGSKVTNFVGRMHTEWEILRRSDILFNSRSGFSELAHLFRADYGSLEFYHALTNYKEMTNSIQCQSLYTDE